MSRFTFGSVIAASALMGAFLSPLPALAASDWGYTCSDAGTADGKKECCVRKQTDCNAECFGNYKDDALKTCQSLCNDKGDKCREDIKGETGGVIERDDWSLIASDC